MQRSLVEEEDKLAAGWKTLALAVDMDAVVDQVEDQCPKGDARHCKATVMDSLLAHATPVDGRTLHW